MTFRIVCCIGAALAGVVVGVLAVGQSRTTYLLNGTRIDVATKAPSFLVDHADEIRTKTTIDYDGLLFLASPEPPDVVPAVVIRGDLRTPHRVTLAVLILHPTLALLGVTIGLYGRHRLRRRTDSES